MPIFNNSSGFESTFHYMIQMQSVHFRPKISSTPPCFLPKCFMGISDVTALSKTSNMASSEEFSVIPYSFEPEYEEGEKSSSDPSSDENSGGSDEEVFGRLLSLEWCKCSNCATTTLSHPRECLCCREVAEASALADFNSEPITCITQHGDFRAVCLNIAVLKTTLIRIKHLTQGMDLSATELPNVTVKGKTDSNV